MSPELSQLLLSLTMFKKMLVVEREKSSKPQPTSHSSKHTADPRNSPSQERLRTPWLGLQRPTSPYQGPSCECGSFCFQWASSFQVVLGWVQLRGTAPCRNPKTLRCIVLQGQRECSRGSGAVARVVPARQLRGRCFFVNAIAERRSQ